MTSLSHPAGAASAPTADSNPVASYALRSELAQFCFPAAHRDAQRKLAWVDSLFNFSVPTRGNLIVPAAMASAPPARPMQALSQPVATPVAAILRPQARGSDRPVPPWPYQLVSGGVLGTATEIKQRGGLGMVVLLAVVETNGTANSLTVQDSSGYPQLDRHTHGPRQGGGSRF